MMKIHNLLLSLLFMAGPLHAMTMTPRYYTPQSTPITEYLLNSEDDSYIRHNNQTIISNEPASPWVFAANGNVPANAVIYYVDRGYPRYRCRVAYNNKIYYGVLFPRNGCIIRTENASMLRFIRYEALTVP